MSDIVERIRMRRLPLGGTFELMDDAADEIARLRAALHWTAQNCLDPACVRRAIDLLEPEPTLGRKTG